MSQNTAKLTGILEEMTLEQVRALNANVVVLPIGSTEPHGPHLPYGTDTFEADGMSRRAVIGANEAGGRVLMLPTLPIGNNVNFKAFPFACRVSVRTLMLVVLDIVSALEEDGIRKIVLVNGHGGNTDTLKATIREHVDRNRPNEGAFLSMVTAGSFIPPHVGAMVEHGSDHAGEYETSCVMFLRPELVHPEKFDNFPVKEAQLSSLRSGDVFYVRPWHGYVPASAGGETRKSSAEKGKALIEEAAKGFSKYLVELSNATIHSNFPYAPKP